MMFSMRVVSTWVKQVIFLPAAMIIFALSFAIFQPEIIYGLSFDYAVGGHSVSIESGYHNWYSWGEDSGEVATTSFSLTGSNLVNYGNEPFAGQVNMAEISKASAAFGDASLGKMGVRAEAVDPSGTVYAAVENAYAHAQMGGAFYIAGPTDTVDLKVRTALDGIIGVTLQQGISEKTLISFEMNAANQDLTPGNHWNTSTGWSISSLSGLDQGGEPYENPGLYFNNDKISDTGSYQFTNYELILILPGVKTNQLFNLDLFLEAQIAGPGFSFYGTTGDKVDFFSTYGMGFTNGSDPAQWFELPDGYSISEASEAPVPVPAAIWLFGSGLLGLLGVRWRFSK